MNPLNALDCPLGGVNLIEASAGTGKTWTIAALYTRLLLEADADGQVPAIDQLLVVTYTKAATAELRGRLRDRLRALVAVLEGSASDDPFLLAMAERHPPGAARILALSRLNAAIVGFDTAAIYTIHGFCQRALSDAAFASGQSFHAELIQDDSQRLLDAVDDYWRRHVLSDALLAGLLAESGETPERWLADIRPYLAKPYLAVDRPPGAGLAAARRALDICWQSLRDGRDDCQAAFELLQRAEGLNARSFGVETRTLLAQTVMRLLAVEGAAPALSGSERKLLDKLTPAVLARAANKGFTPPSHPAFARIGDWLAAWDAYQQAAVLEITRLKLDLIDWLGDELARRRQAERTRSFDDLLTDLYDALRDPVRGPVLAAQLAGSFHAALIDEFQDTDPVQYHIFRNSFIERGRPVFLVGDPKQAIYSFRGADVFAYLEARADTLPQNRYTLDVNRRSQSALVDAVNALFARPKPFVLPEIGYQPVAAAGPATRLVVEDDRAPCNWQWLDFGDSAKGASKRLAAEQSAQNAAAEIARLLALSAEGRASLCSERGQRPLGGGDCAVLVSTHRQGEIMRAALAALNIPSVALTQESVFASREARELLILLSAWAHPGDETRLRHALATELYGFAADEIAACLQDETAWEAQLAWHAEDHQRWRQQGMMAAWRHFLARRTVAERLLPLPDGERRLTNLSHLAELLQNASEEQQGMLPLLDWFELQVNGEQGGEAALLRLESDASLVKIATVHSAKGLQYPVVFCPFLWDGALERRDMPFWRSHGATGSRLTPEVLLDDATREAARNELLAEKLRLAYVALTRAEHRQYIAWGWVQQMETAALAWLLHAPPETPLAQLTALDGATVRSQLQDWIRRQGPTVAWQEAEWAPALTRTAQGAAGVYAPARIARPIYTPWRVASFSGLVHHSGTPERERPDHDRGGLTLPETDDATVPFPRGARAGTCLHAILEQVDFAAPSLETVREIVALHGFAPSHAEAAYALVCRTLAAPLDDGVSLALAEPARRLIELEFTLPVEHLRLDALRSVLRDARHGLHPLLSAAAAGLDFSAVRGFLKGFIDLVCEIDGRFYLVDYKSNDLGAEPADYDDERLAQSVAREHYYLQYLFYCVAIRRYLHSRGVDFTARFAGVRYLYMRGVDAAGHGVWRDMPSSTLLDALDALFAA
ncbi:exodeoxyribonuclease V subunit beta [Paludibacterium purpuratum]|uniref:RecBCD enzyme subunit RecB n=1 Tax=Paludibacterium purpuratum TaxID=1144873 RepID=A0A4R7B191_9NEIS|nr:exodeoxyribonuclease V subunit beta [Paludibacterium purpuratum]TDR76679.1 DNA helicase/exodeoxyribonuclease V beta subunit [Paludibacterium purpuratum]